MPRGAAFNIEYLGTYSPAELTLEIIKAIVLTEYDPPLSSRYSSAELHSSPTA